MTYIMIDELVRREVSKLLRVDYRGKFLCSSCLVKLVRDTLGTSYTTSEALHGSGIAAAWFC